ncbi:hypothetical protein, partial [Clostridium psychrophilum]|uniref:hypothetical protein n=2 Tax=Clostridium psychrophilum TaxID=132926 RepID=UPI001C0E84EB
EGISKNEVNGYISSRLKLCGIVDEIFNANAIEAINSCCNGSTRLLNTILEKSLMMGYQKGLKVIDTEIVMSVQNEINLI